MCCINHWRVDEQVGEREKEKEKEMGEKGKERERTNHNVRQVLSPGAGKAAPPHGGGHHCGVFHPFVLFSSKMGFWTLRLPAYYQPESFTSSQHCLELLLCSFIAFPKVWALRNNQRARSVPKEMRPSLALLVTGTQTRPALKLLCLRCSRLSFHRKPVRSHGISRLPLYSHW